MTQKYQYPASVKVIDAEGITVLHVVTQIYSMIGVYVAVYQGEQCVDQYNLSPEQTIEFMKQFEQENLTDGHISQFGPIKTVQQIDELWKEI